MRLDWKELLGIGSLFAITVLTWSAAEFSTVTFHDRIENELRTVTASDMSASTTALPDDATRTKLQEIGAHYGARTSESVEFPLTLQVGSTGTGSKYVTTDVRIVG